MQWIILLGNEVCAVSFEKITCMSSFCQVAKSEWEPELYLWVNSSEFRNVSSGDTIVVTMTRCGHKLSLQRGLVRARKVESLRGTL